MTVLPSEVKAFMSEYSNLSWLDYRAKVREFVELTKTGAAPMISSTEMWDEIPDVSCEDYEWNEEQDINGISQKGKG